MRVREMDEFLRHLDPNKREAGSDGLKFGDPEAAITGICITWMASLNVLQAAVAKGLNLICAHEPTFYWDAADDRDELNLAQIYKTPTQLKTDFLTAHNMAVIRVRDLWDMFPKYGIQDSWADAAGLGDVVKAEPHHRVYSTPKQSIGDLAGRLKKELRLPLVRVVGDLHRSVTLVSVGIGYWGMLHNILAAQRLGAEVHIAGESMEWQAVRYAEDNRFPLIFAGDSTGHEQGMRNMAVFLGERFRHLKIEFIPTGDPFSYI